jgi:hypothetical protein
MGPEEDDDNWDFCECCRKYVDAGDVVQVPTKPLDEDGRPCYEVVCKTCYECGVEERN